MPKINRTVKRALDVMELLMNENKPMKFTQISEALDLPRSSAFDILNTLLARNYIEYANEEAKTFQLGSKAFEVGAAYLHNTELAPTARPYVEKIMNETGATSFLAIENNGQLVYLDKVEAPTAIRTTALLGSRNEMHCTGLGKAILAYYPEEKVKKIFEKSKKIKHTENTIIDFDDLKVELALTRQRGYSIDNREMDPSVFCIAAPIFDVTKKPIAAISVAMMYTKLNEEENLIDKYSILVMDCADQISKKLGYIR